MRSCSLYISFQFMWMAVASTIRSCNEFSGCVSLNFTFSSTVKTMEENHSQCHLNVNEEHEMKFSFSPHENNGTSKSLLFVCGLRENHYNLMTYHSIWWSFVRSINHPATRDEKNIIGYDICCEEKGKMDYDFTNAQLISNILISNRAHLKCMQKISKSIWLVIFSCFIQISFICIFN